MARCGDGRDGASSDAAKTLADIETTGRDALAELRRMLGVLRDEADPTPLRPQPGLAQLEELVARAKHAGIQIEGAIDGVPLALPAGIDLACYRIVQESLTTSPNTPLAASRTWGCATTPMRSRSRSTCTTVSRQQPRKASQVVAMDWRACANASRSMAGRSQQPQSPTADTGCTPACRLGHHEHQRRACR